MFFIKASESKLFTLFFNGGEVQSVPNQKHLGLVLDCKIGFNEHINNKIKVNVIKSKV